MTRTIPPLGLHSPWAIACGWTLTLTASRMPGNKASPALPCMLKDTVGAVLQTTTTDFNGNYLFDVAVGSYQVTFETPSDYVVSPSDKGSDDNLDSDIINPATKTTGTIAIAAGEQNLSVDAGVYQTASLGDRVWLDCNGNGVQDGGEVGVANVTVKLIGGGADGVINGIGDTTRPTTTNASGNYAFTGLTPGVEYQVQVRAADRLQFHHRQDAGSR
jgi:hypothetical protein